MANFASRLRKLRKEKKLRQKDLADKLDLAQTTIANYEQDVRFPNQQVLVQIANYFNVSLDYLLGRTDNKRNPKQLLSSAAINIDQDNSLIPLAKEYLNTLLDGKEYKAYGLIQEAIDDVMEIQEVYLEIFEPALKTVGKLWEQNKITVAQEHYFTSATESIMSKICPRVNSENQDNYSLVSLSTTGEFHNVGIRMVTDFFSMEGWKTYYLGSNVPTSSVINTLQNSEVDLLIISATISYNLERVKNLITAVRSQLSKSELKIMVGGAIFNQNSELWKEVGADAFAPNAKEAIKLATKLVE